jgi:methionyl-tRNA formyltransferase
MNDPITGGTVFWLNSGIDRGDIERQQWIWLDKTKTAAEVWRDELLPLGVKLIRSALADISNGKINRAPQDGRFSTFEPSLEVKDVFKPDLLMLTQ